MTGPHTTMKSSPATGESPCSNKDLSQPKIKINHLQIKYSSIPDGIQGHDQVMFILEMQGGKYEYSDINQSDTPILIV